MRLFCSLILVLLAACSSEPPKYYSIEDNARQNMANYRLDRNEFYGFTLLQPITNTPAGTAVKIDEQTGGKKYIFKDPEQTFSIITLYESAGVLTRITLARSDESARQSEQFYQNLLDQAKQDYPKNIFVDSGIGAYMHFLNDSDAWVKEYADFESAKLDKKQRYSSVARPFSKGLHQSLATISFNQFAGKANKTYVMVDYITIQYQIAGKNQSNQMKSKMIGI